MSRYAAAGAVLLLVAAAFVAGGAAAPAFVSHYADATYGFSLQPPAFPKADQGTVVPAIFFAPAENGFSNNVTVIVQNIATSREAFHKQAIERDKAKGVKLLTDVNLTVSGKDAFLMSTEDTQKDRTSRFLTLAVFDTSRVYVVTCVATQETYAKTEKEFMACVNSFALAK
jgi:hypothetical protein